MFNSAAATATSLSFRHTKSESSDSEDSPSIADPPDSDREQPRSPSVHDAYSMETDSLPEYISNPQPDMHISNLPDLPRSNLPASSLSSIDTDPSQVNTYSNGNQLCIIFNHFSYFNFYLTLPPSRLYTYLQTPI